MRNGPLRSRFASRFAPLPAADPAGQPRHVRGPPERTQGLRENPEAAVELPCRLGGAYARIGRVDAPPPELDRREIVSGDSEHDFEHDLARRRNERRGGPHKCGAERQLSFAGVVRDDRVHPADDVDDPANLPTVEKNDVAADLAREGPGRTASHAGPRTETADALGRARTGRAGDDELIGSAAVRDLVVGKDHAVVDGEALHGAGCGAAATHDVARKASRTRRSRSAVRSGAGRAAVTNRERRRHTGSEHQREVRATDTPGRGRCGSLRAKGRRSERRRASSARTEDVSGSEGGARENGKPTDARAHANRGSASSEMRVVTPGKYLTKEAFCAI